MLKHFPFLFLFLLLTASGLLEAQTARVQVIHNSPDPTVDVYVNGALVFDDFAFRSAYPFTDLPAGVSLSIAIAPSTSTSVTDAIATFDATFEAGKTYAVTASGIVGNTDTPFTLLIDDAAKESSSDPARVEVSITHGSPDAPAVDIRARTIGSLVNNLSYPQQTGYLSLAPDVYYLDILPAGSNNILATFQADLTGFTGQAIRVLASGLLNGTPGFTLIAVTAEGAVVELPVTPVARVQVIHNSPTPTVDIYADDALLLDNFQYRTATSFLYIPAETDIVLGVALDTSTSSGSAIATFPVNFENGKTYVVVANGQVGNGTAPFGLVVNDMGRETAPDTNSVSAAVFHGAIGAPSVDVDAVLLSNNVITDLTYGNFTAYLPFEPRVYDLAIRPSGGTTPVASYRVDLRGLKGGAAYVFASGVFGADPAFGLFAALADGTVIEFPATPVARVQVIHNSPDPTVDVYADNALLIDDFVFRTATPYVTVPADRDIQFGVAPSSSTSTADAIFTATVTFAADQAYTVFANGIVFNPSTPFTLVANESRETASDPGNVEFIAFHGSTDAPGVDVEVVGAGTIYDNLEYNQFGDTYVSVPPADYLVQIKVDATGDLVNTYIAPLSSLVGQSLTVFASGNVSGQYPAFGLFAALADGTVIPLADTTLPVPQFARAQFIHNAIAPTVDVYFNSELAVDDFEFRQASGFIDVPAGVTIAVGIAPANSTSVADAIATIDVTFEPNKTYIVTASGILGGTPGFSLNLFDSAREFSLDSNSVEVAVLHGSPDAPAVDVDAVFVANSVVANLPYGSVAGYLNLQPTLYDLAVRPAGLPLVVATFRADLSGLKGQSAFVFASGLLSGNPAFGLFAALADGTVIELPATPLAQVQIIHNSPTPTVDVYAGNTLLVDNFEFRTATPYVSVPADRDIQFGIAPSTSTSVSESIFFSGANFPGGGTYTVVANGVAFNPSTPLTLVAGPSRETASIAGNVEFIAFHGSPDAPAVDIDVVGAGTVYDALAYGEFGGDYASVLPAEYLVQVKIDATGDLVNTYLADLTGLTNQAITVFASGFAGGNFPAFGLFAALADGTVIELPVVTPPGPTTRVQIIHNSPTPTVDVYIDGQLAINDFEYRTATPYLDLPANVQLSVAIAPGNSTSVSDAIATFPVTFSEGVSYTVIADGEVGNSSNPFTLVVDAAAEETAPVGAVRLSVYHGAPNAPAVDVAERLLGTLFSDVVYQEFTPYGQIDAGEYYIDVKIAGQPDIVETYYVDLTALDGLAARIMASGFLGQDPQFGLFAVLPNGIIVELPVERVARIQILHNSPDASLETVDIYLNQFKVIEDFPFRAGTPYFYLPADFGFTISIAPGTSTSVAEAVGSFPVNLENGKTYFVTATGIVGSTTTPLVLFANDQAREFPGPSDELTINVFHGSNNAPAVDVQLAENGFTVIDGLAYGQFTDYLSLPLDFYLLDVVPDAGPIQAVGTWGGNFTGLGGVTGTVFASGLLGADPAFELWLVLPSGQTLPLAEFARLQVIHNSPSPVVDVYINDNLFLNNFSFREATNMVFIPTRTPFTVNVAPGSSTSASESIYSLDLPGLTTGRTYIAVANGIVGNATTPFEIVVTDNGRYRSYSDATIDITAFHGSPNAPSVDVTLPNGLPIVNDLNYGTFSSYLSVPPATYILNITPADDNASVVASYRAQLDTLVGRSAVVFASGLLNDNPSFGLWVALPDGLTFPLEQLVSTEEPGINLNDFKLMPNPVSDELNIRFNLEESAELRYTIRDMAGRVISEGDYGQQPAGPFGETIDASGLKSGIYLLEIGSEKGVETRRFAVQR